MIKQHESTCRLTLIAFAMLAATAAQAADPELRPRLVPPKPVAFQLSPHDSRSVLVVKFREGLRATLDGALKIDGREVAALNAPGGVAGARWLKSYQQPEERLRQLHGAAQANLRCELADPNLYYRLRLPEGSDAAAVVNALNALDLVELALSSHVPAPPPLPPNFQPQQIYIEAAPPGIGAVPCWDVQGITGEGVRVGDIEYNWLLTHQDLPPVINSGLTPALPDPSHTHHGAAVLGMIGAKPNGWGTTGMAPGAELHVSTAWSVELSDGIDIAIYELLEVFEPGDVIQLEAQVSSDLGSGETFYPVELFFSNREAIMTAVGNGIVVVEAAGNGGVFLNPTFQVFHPEFDTGALVVGAGAAPPPYGADGTWLSFSNYGPMIDLQGWGQAVRTTGYGDLYSAMGVNYFYTAGFSGTSSATPMVTAAAALLQSAAMEVRGVPLTPDEVRTALRAVGTPQPSSDSSQPGQWIGPRPDVHAAILSLFDCDENGIIDSRDIEQNPSLDCDRNGKLDSCEFGPLSFASNELFPLGTSFGTTYSPSYTIDQAPAAGDEVTLQFWAVGDLGFSSENIAVSLNGEALGTIYQSGGHDCPQAPDEATLVVSESAWNAAASSGKVVIAMTPSAGVDAILCSGGSWIKVKATYVPAVSLDADGDGVLDVCGKKPTPGDLDGDGQVNGFDLALLLGAWGACPPKSACSADLDGNGIVNGIDLAVLLAAWG